MAARHRNSDPPPLNSPLPCTAPLPPASEPDYDMTPAPTTTTSTSRVSLGERSKSAQDASWQQRAELLESHDSESARAATVPDILVPTEWSTGAQEQQHDQPRGPGDVLLVDLGTVVPEDEVADVGALTARAKALALDRGVSSSPASLIASKSTRPPRLAESTASSHPSPASSQAGPTRSNGTGNSAPSQSSLNHSRDTSFTTSHSMAPRYGQVQAQGRPPFISTPSQQQGKRLAPYNPNSATSGMDPAAAYAYHTGYQQVQTTYYQQASPYPYSPYDAYAYDPNLYAQGSPALQPMSSPLTSPMVSPYSYHQPLGPSPPPPLGQQHPQGYGSPPLGPSPLTYAPSSAFQPYLKNESPPTNGESTADGTTTNEEGAIVYGSDGSPATSAEMLALAQSQQLQQQQQQFYGSPYSPYPPSSTFSSPSLPYPTDPTQQRPSGFAMPVDYSHYEGGGGGQQPYTYPIQHQRSPPGGQAPPQQGPGSSGPYPFSQQYPYAGPPPPPPPPPIPPQFNQYRSPQYPSQYPYGSPGYPLAPVPPPLPSQPSIYAPPPELARGQLAQSRLHDAVYERDTIYPMERRRLSSGGGGAGATGVRSALPKPPAHSPHALWVGNVPSDASHQELWRFFTTRPPPSSSVICRNQAKEMVLPANIDINSTGVESIHLITRSNCAFVNYASDMHLQHSIAVSNGVPLRPRDPRCKDLVCRVRKRDEEAKTGVGAQRIGGMHTAFVKGKEKEARDAARETGEGGEAVVGGGMGGGGGTRHGTNTSISTASTSSSFLTKHFEKRFFILKSHDEDDLRLSVERGLWATQGHNEPVLDQAFHTSKEVFLVFGANKSGEWFGYARMTSSISGAQPASISWSSSGDTPSSGARSDIRPPTIAEVVDENNGQEGAAPSSTLFPPGPPSPTFLFSPSEQRLAQTPSPVSPAAPRNMAAALASTGPPKATSAPTTLGRLVPGLTNASLPHATAGSLDPKALIKLPGTSSNVKATALAQAQAQGQGQGESATLDDDGVWRRDTLASATSAVERNARLDTFADEDVAAASESRQVIGGWGKPFKVQWIKVARLPFSRTRSIKNAFNAGREVKISRDGTEIEPSAGEALLAEFWRDDDPDLATTTKDPVPSDSTSPPSLHIITASGLVGGA